MRPAWNGIAGWLCILTAAGLALFAVPCPVNGWALLAVVLAVVGGALVATSVSRPMPRGKTAMKRVRRPQPATAQPPRPLPLRRSVHPERNPS
jgi:uncharacterized protein (DUF58 family)